MPSRVPATRTHVQIETVIVDRDTDNALVLLLMFETEAGERRMYTASGIAGLSGERGGAKHRWDGPPANGDLPPRHLRHMQISAFTRAALEAVRLGQERSAVVMDMAYIIVPPANWGTEKWAIHKWLAAHQALNPFLTEEELEAAGLTVVFENATEDMSSEHFHPMIRFYNYVPDKRVIEAMVVPGGAVAWPRANMCAVCGLPKR